MPTKKYENTITLTAKMPAALRERLRAEATSDGMSMNAWLVRMLTELVDSLDGIGPAEGAVPEVPVRKMEPAKLETDERNVRHLSPIARPVETRIRKGFTISEADCIHPKDKVKVFSYMTQCGMCGRRIR